MFFLIFGFAHIENRPKKRVENLYLKNLSLFTFTDPCSSLSCQHICINTKSGAKCFCSEGYNLAADLKSCTGWELCI